MVLKKLISIALCLALLWTSANLAEAAASPTLHFSSSIHSSPIASFNQEALTSASTQFRIPLSIGASVLVIVGIAAVLHSLAMGNHGALVQGGVLAAGIFLKPGRISEGSYAAKQPRIRYSASGVELPPVSDNTLARANEIYSPFAGRDLTADEIHDAMGYVLAHRVSMEKAVTDLYKPYPIPLEYREIKAGMLFVRENNLFRIEEHDSSQGTYRAREMDSKGWENSTHMITISEGEIRNAWEKGIGQKIPLPRLLEGSGLTADVLSKLLHTSEAIAAQWITGESTPDFATMIRLQEVVSDVLPGFDGAGYYWNIRNYSIRRRPISNTDYILTKPPILEKYDHPQNFVLKLLTQVNAETQRKWTLEDYSRELGYPRNFLSNLLKSSAPFNNLELFVRLGKAFGFNGQELFWVYGNPSKQEKRPGRLILRTAASKVMTAAAGFSDASSTVRQKSPIHDKADQKISARQPKLQIPTDLQKHFGGKAELKLIGKTVREALNALAPEGSSERKFLFDAEGKLRPYVALYDTQDQPLTLDSPLPNGPIGLVGQIVAGSSDRDLPPPSISPLDHYHDLKILEADTRNTVYRGTDPRTNHFVVIKVETDKKVIAAEDDLAHEQRILTKLYEAGSAGQNFIPHLLSHGVLKDDRVYKPYLILDYFEGVSLHEYLQNSGPLQSADALSIFFKILEAVKAIHASGVAHGDLKPKNILIRFEQNGSIAVRLIDFEGAFDLQRDQPRNIPRTRFFAAPEIARRKLSQATERSDVYALAGILLSLLTGYTVTTVGFHDIPTEMAAHPNLDDKLRQTILAAAASDPSDRFANVAEFESALKKEQATTARNEHPGPQHADEELLYLHGAQAVLAFVLQYLNTPIKRQILSAILHPDTEKGLLDTVAKIKGSIDVYKEFLEDPVKLAQKALTSTGEIGITLDLEFLRGVIEKFLGRPINFRDIESQWDTHWITRLEKAQQMLAGAA